MNVRKFDIIRSNSVMPYGPYWLTCRCRSLERSLSFQMVSVKLIRISSFSKEPCSIIEPNLTCLFWHFILSNCSCQQNISIRFLTATIAALSLYQICSLRGGGNMLKTTALFCRPAGHVICRPNAKSKHAAHHQGQGPNTSFNLQCLTR